MGGDDLGSDDDYLIAPVTATGDESSDDGSVHGSNNDNRDQEEDGEEPTSQRKRQREDTNSQRIKANSQKDIEDEPASKKTKSRQPKEGKLRELAHGLEHATTETQASFLTTLTGVNFRSHQLVAARNDKDDDIQGDSSIASRLAHAISKKKLKKWNVPKSPMVIVVCLSARRAVAVLKELSRYKLRIAKLFAKHLTVQQQVQMLQSTSFPIAVGTPHRLVTLLSGAETDDDHRNDNNDKDQTTASKPASIALSLARTRLVILDSHVNPKKYTVCTLPDTAPHVRDLLLDHVHPQLKRRKDLHLAFL